ncbi:MAG: hypothetical protein P4L53_23925 [Candidatus Obscuribacterales bacterium]|nr:hypothetical protein [Candidatus Obscuribacterales bacterium]
MRILLIDDLRIPGDHRNKKQIPADAAVARTFREGIAELQKGNWDVLYLDHDLADFSGAGGRELTGYTVMCWLEEFPQYVPAKDIIIVSDNSSGMLKMKMVINKLYGRLY